MSGIAAVFHFDGSNVEGGTLEFLTQEMHYRGPDGITHWHGAAAALGFCAMHTTSESLLSTQPLISEDRNLVLVLDGYLHNLEELREELRARGATLRDRSDAEVVLRAYEVWGEDCPLRLEGEFAFVIWDSRRRSAFCARDHAGLRPLHYHWDGKRLTVASDSGAVLIAPGVPQDLNKEIAAQVVASDWITRGETIWKGVKRLLPATWARFGRDGMRSETYWSPTTEVMIRYSRDEDYYEHYRELLENCVRRASRSHLPIASDVSGGLDSSAVFAVAEDLRRSGQLLAPEVKGYTFKFEAGSDAFELDYARSVAQHVGADVQEIEPFLPELEWFAERGRLDRDLAPYPNSVMAVSIGEALTKDGCRACLNGEGGDEWLGGRAYYYAEQIAEQDWAALLKSFKEDLPDIGVREAIYRLARFGLLPFVPVPLISLARGLVRPKSPKRFNGSFWLDSTLEHVLEECRNSADRTSVVAIANRPRRSMFETLQDPFLEFSRDQVNRQYARIGYEPRTPMYARKFIEFAFSTPERIRLRGHVRKHAHIHALNGLLPEKVRNRRTKADFSLAFTRHLDKMEDTFVNSVPAIGRGYLSQSGMKRLYGCYRKFRTDGGPIWELWGAFACSGPIDLSRKKSPHME